MASAAILSRTRSAIRTLHSNDRITNRKSITTFSFLSQQAQLADSPPPPPQPQSTTPLPPNPASGSPLYNQNWRSPFPASSSSSSTALSTYPVPYVHPAPSWVRAFSETPDVQGLKNAFAGWMTSHEWADIKQAFEYWVRSLDKDGKPNRPDVDLYNHYLRANFMNGASPAELLDLVAQMKDFRILPNTASFNLVLKAMNQSRESVAAEKLLQRMIQTGGDSLPDDESYNLVISMLFVVDQIDTALRNLDTALKAGYTMSREVFHDCVRSCCNKGRLDYLVSVIERCKKMDQNKSLCPDWIMCNTLAEVSMQKDNSSLAFYSLEFMIRLIARGVISRPPALRSVNEGLIVSALATAGRTYSSKLLDGAWEILKQSLRQKKVPSPESYLAKIYAYSSLGKLPKAFSTLKEFEEAYRNSDSEAINELFSPFTSLKPLVLASSKKGFTTLDEVYYQLENLSQATNPPYKSIAALNCVILGCANIWDVDRAYQTFNAIDATFGLTPDVHSYNALICAFGKLNKRDEAVKVFEHFVGLGVKPNAMSYSQLVDAHLIHRDPKAALAVVADMVRAGYEPTKEMLKKVRRRCIREMDYDSDARVDALAKEFKIRMGSEVRRGLLFNLQYTEYV